jgi:hypothetical protein
LKYYHLIQARKTTGNTRKTSGKHQGNTRETSYDFASKSCKNKYIIILNLDDFGKQKYNKSTTFF